MAGFKCNESPAISMLSVYADQLVPLSDIEISRRVEERIGETTSNAIISTFDIRRCIREGSGSARLVKAV